MRKPKAGLARSDIGHGWRKPTHEWAIIQAGGDGTRLRDLSYKVSGDRRPKQFCAFFGGKSLLAHTRDRLQPLFLDQKTFFVLNHAHRVYYWKELADVPSSQQLVQPLNHGTAPAIALAVLEIMGRDPDCTIAFFPIGPSLPRKLAFPSYYRSGIAIGYSLRRPRLGYRSTCNLSGSAVRVHPTRPIVSDSRLNALQYASRFWEKPNLVEARALLRSGCLWNTFVMIGSGAAFLGLLGATVPHLLAAIGDWFSAPDLDRIYREIEPIDFSREVLSAAPERLFVLCDGPSGWTDFGSPQRAMDVLQGLSVLSRV